MILFLPREKSGVVEANTLARWLKASFDALERKYLRELTLLIYLDPAKPEEVQEKFTFSFCYKDGVANISLGFNQSTVDMSKLKGDTEALLRHIVMVTQGLGSLPEDAYLAIRLKYYDDVTPVDYEPEGFTPDTTQETPMPERIYRVDLGAVGTAFHGLKVKVEAKNVRTTFVNDDYQLGAVESQSQSQQLDGESQSQSQQLDGESQSQSQQLDGESQSLSQQLEEETLSQPQQLLEEPSPAASQDLFDEESSQPLVGCSQELSESVGGRNSSQDRQDISSQLSFSSEAATVSLAVKTEPVEPAVSCVCLATSRDSLMLLCSSCSTKQHAACYRLLTTDELPAKHTCWDCSKRLDVPCTDTKMERCIRKGKDVFVPTFLYRRVLALLDSGKSTHVTPEKIKVELDIMDGSLDNLLKTLLSHEVVAESSKGQFIVKKDGLMKALAKFMGTGNSSSQRSSSNTTVPKRKMKKSSMSKKNSKKSKTSDDLIF